MTRWFATWLVVCDLRGATGATGWYGAAADPLLENAGANPALLPADAAPLRLTGSGSERGPYWIATYPALTVCFAVRAANGFGGGFTASFAVGFAPTFAICCVTGATVAAVFAAAFAPPSSTAPQNCGFCT